jgi:hypothetical protein
MRVSTFALSLTLVTGAALAVAACGSRPAATNVATNAASVANDLNTPMNDASAIETTTNAGITPPASNLANSTEAPIGPTRGGDTGGNTVQSNIAGM